MLTVSKKRLEVFRKGVKMWQNKTTGLAGGFDSCVWEAAAYSVPFSQFSNFSATAS